ncbi:MAG: hypothetical protein H6659_10855 [Ardenticatenaceae bacterium]|nr:hypothetical protein [Ardenticatenaceae bacterium]
MRAHFDENSEFIGQQPFTHVGKSALAGAGWATQKLASMSAPSVTRAWEVV